MTPTDLTGTERAVLIVLMAESRPVANPELATLGPALDKPGRDKLNALGLIESERIKGRYVHELTDRGWALCRDIVAAGPPPRSTGPAKTLYTVLGALGRYLQRSEVSLAELFWPAEAETSEDETPGRETLEDRVRAAYARLAPRPGGWVRLAELRAAKRMNGATDYLPIMADCHRALGQPQQAIKLAQSPSVANFAAPAKAEMTIVEAGARRDMGQLDAALRVLEQAPLMNKSREPWVVRLRYAYADTLEAAGRPTEALTWFHRTDAIDAEELTDAAARAASLESASE